MGSLPDKGLRQARFLDALRDCLSDRELGETRNPNGNGNGYESLAGFNLARIVQGLLIEHGYPVLKLNAIKVANIVRPVVADYASGYDADITIEAMVDCWDRIVCPEGYDPVWYAAQKADVCPSAAPGEYATATQASHAGRIWCVLRALPKDDAGRVYVTMRRLAEELNLDKQTVCFAIRALERNKVIELASKGGQGTANRYKVLVV